MIEQNFAKTFIEELAGKKNVLITGHVDPDSDCVGSMLGVFYALGGPEKGWQMVLQDDIPAHAAFLPGAEKIQKPDALTMQPEAVLLLDCSECARAGEWVCPYWQTIPRYIIDHHQNQPDAAKLALCDPTAAATGELIADLLFAAGWQIDRQVAYCLYTALSGDTGGFRYMNTTPHTLALASHLMTFGIDTEEIRINLFENLSRTNMQMLAVALRSAEYHMDGKLCLLSLPRVEKIAHGAGRGDTSNIVNYTIATRGVRVGVLLDEFDDYVKISLRTRRGYAANVLAAHFGGGGHMQAAGCRIPGDLAYAKKQVVQAALEILFHIKSV